MGDVREVVRERYGRIASSVDVAPAEGCCGGGSSCGSTNSLDIGYSESELSQIPEGANLGLGCGNPQGIAALSPGETVLDLGSGGGIDCFLAAKQVGDSGWVIGVDMTPQMMARARANAAKSGVRNVEFRLGEIEHLPVADESVDVILSNCVVNLSPDKPAVFREAFRVLKPGGRLAISDMVATGPLPEEVRNNLDSYTGCIGGAAEISELEKMLSEVGFVDVRVSPKAASRDLVVSANIEARRP
ncbi:MAG TPA: arsenite methyltransferase [Vicinamibacteria bacterium]